MKANPRWIIALAGPLVLLAIILWLVLWVLGVRVWLSAIISIVLAAVAAAILYLSTDNIVRSSVGGRPVERATSPRLANLVEDLCVRAGLSEPALFLIDNPVPDAIAYGRSPQTSSIAVTSGLVDDLSLVELEGILARELSRIKQGDIRLDTLAVPFIKMFTAPFGSLGKMIVQWARGSSRDVEVDLAGVALSGYPPGLIGGLQHIKNGSLKGKSAGRGSKLTEHLWTRGLGTSQADPGTWTLDERIAVLREL